MRTLLTLLITALLSPAPASQSPASQSWQEVRSAEGAFRVQFPGEARYDATEVPTRVGTIRMHRWILEIGNTAYQIIYADYPEAYVRATTPDAMLESALTQMREGIRPGAAFESVIPFAVAGGTGREHVTDIGGTMMKGRSMLVGTRLYQVLAGVPSTERAARSAQIDRFLNSFVLTPLTIAPAPAAPAATAWSELVSKDGGFRVMLPGQATYSVQTVPTNLGPLQMHSWILDFGTAGFAVLYGDYPATHVQNTGADTIVRNAVKGLLDSWKPGAAAFDTETAINLGSYPGREYSVDAGGYFNKGRTLLVGNRLYQVLARAPSAQRAAAEIDFDRFLASFAIIATSKGAPH
jgi:hypothetical protein